MQHHKVFCVRGHFVLLGSDVYFFIYFRFVLAVIFPDSDVILNERHNYKYQILIVVMTIIGVVVVVFLKPRTTRM